MNTVTIILLLFIAIFVAFFIFRRKLVIVMDWALKLLFPILLILVLIALLAPQVFVSISDSVLRNGGTYDYLVGVDTDLNTVLDLPNQILGGIGSLFGGPTGVATEPTNLLETSVYPGLVESLAGILRIVVLAGSLFGMGVVTYLSFLTGNVTDVSKLEKKVKKLEEEVESLKNSEVAIINE